MKYAVLVLAVCLLGCTSQKPLLVEQPVDGSVKKDTLRILTYNIHHANPPSRPDYIDLPAIAKVVLESGADLVALQEVDVHTERSGKESDQAAELGKLTGMYHYFAKAIDYQGGAYGVAILSKLPFVKTESHPLPQAEGLPAEPRVLALVTVEPVAGKPLVFGCTHLDLKPEHRILQAQHIAAVLAPPDKPVILGGDLNAVPGSDEISYLDRYFQRSSIPNGFTVPVNSPRREIDFILHKPIAYFSVVKHQVINELYASDHLPVYVEYVY